MDIPPMTVVETPFFLRKVSSLLNEDARSKLIMFLGLNPDAGNLIPQAAVCGNCGGLCQAKESVAVCG